MPKPSVYKQVEATAVGKYRLKVSPRHWNNSLFRYKDKLWMSYRFHMNEPGSRCQTAICPINEATLQPSGESQWLSLKGSKPDDHHEDARMFTYLGEPYMSITEMTGYKPGVDFRCVIKYARLKLTKGVWSVLEVYHPMFGVNDGSGKEKNWAFFEADGKLYCVYAGAPRHTVIEIKGDKVIAAHITLPAAWPWGLMRGGTPPIPTADGNFLSIFHSSLPTEKPPAYVRYFAGAYVFSGKPPFECLKISPRPFLAGSEEDGHQVDPRYVDGWKPFVVFPGGLVQNKDGFLMAFGVNDWQCAIARIKPDGFPLIACDGSFVVSRYFTRENGSIPVEYIGADFRKQYLHWQVPREGPACSPGVGYMRVGNVREAEEVSETAGCSEITADQYQAGMRGLSNASMLFR